jgi:Rad3-related DNA helicase
LIPQPAPLTIEELLGPAGRLARALPGYEHRADQLAMAHAVGRALGTRGYLVAEAGTGTGKTLAYLAPAALSGRRLIVSTATKTLQEQIWHKDIPLLRDACGLSFAAAYLKGRSNYYCLARGDEFARAPTFAAREEAALWPRIEAWARETETGDRAEIDLPDQFLTWRDLSATSESCVGRECPRFEECFVTRARARAAEADVLLVNHHPSSRTSRCARRGRGWRSCPSTTRSCSTRPTPSRRSRPSTSASRSRRTGSRSSRATRSAPSPIGPTSARS